MNMLAQREHSRVELQRKLGVKFDSELVDKIIFELANEGLQSDQRFIESFISSKINRGQGPLKISYELRNKGIASEVIEQHLEVYQGDWLELARDVLRQKFGDTIPKDHKERQKQQRFIAGRGFPNDICYRIFD